jgi:hypothetical protein
MADEGESPLIKALPPETDYMTYLTIIEYNLTPESLPILHKVLQDEKLTTNIGWDLVHLLVPMLPDSEQCLQDIARLGNPREVILKVTESLRLIEYEEPEELPEPENALAGASDPRVRAESSTYPIKTAPTAEGESRPGSGQMVELPPPLPLAVNQFIALLSMLAILHARLKAKSPSSFLSTSLQAILASFSKATTHKEEMVQAIVSTIKSIHGVQRPTLPSRKSSGMLSMAGAVNSTTSAADPEGAPNTEVSPEEKATQMKLLQSFITHVTEEYLLDIPSSDLDDVPGLAWCSRIMEKTHPERSVPGAETFTLRFEKEQSLHRRIDALGQLVTLSQDLKLSDDALLSTAIEVEKVAAAPGDEIEADPPTSAEEIPLSRFGSLFLYTARQCSSILYESEQSVLSPTASSSAMSDVPFAIFPDHHELLSHCLSSPEQSAGTFGPEPASLLDAALALGLICVERNSIGEPASDEQFNEYLQVTALLSSNCPSPNLRGHAHYLTTTVLRSQPDENVRLAFIKDTLEHCPFENLKAVAVGWIKGEIIEANPPTLPGHDGHAHDGDREHTHEDDDNDHAPSLFATPLPLDSLAPSLFPSLGPDLLPPVPVQEAWMHFQSNLSFYMASLNFLYLLLSAKHLHQSLGIQELWKDHDIGGSFLRPLGDALERFREAMEQGSELEGEVSEGVLAELGLVGVTIERVKGAVKGLNG